MGMNVTHGPLADKRVRQAIRYAIDYEGIVGKILGGAGKQINTIIPEGFAGYESRIIYKTDLNKARELMKEAGQAQGFETTLDHMDATPQPELAQAIQSALSQIGIKVQINKMVGAQLYPKYRAQKRLGSRLSGPAHERPAVRRLQGQPARVPQHVQQRADFQDDPGCRPRDG